MERVHKSRTVVDDWSLWPSCSSPVTYGPRRHVRHRIGRALNLNISDHRSNQTRRAESRNDSFVSAASRAACTVWSMAIDQAPASEALLDSRNLQPAIRVECGLGAARVANPVALATLGGLPLADLNGAHHSFSSAASFIIAGFLPRYWFVFTKTACSSSTERHYIHGVLTSHDEDAFAGVTGRGSRCRAGRHFRVRALSRLITSGDYRARCVPESSRSSACRWCSKLCSERVNTRQIGIGRDRIAIGRFLSGNRKIGRDSRNRCARAHQDTGAETETDDAVRRTHGGT